MVKINKKLSGQRLRQERHNLALSQSDVAEKIGAAEISISRWEQGTMTPHPYYMRELCKLFDKSTRWLFPSENSDDASEDSEELFPPVLESLTATGSVFHYNTALTDASEFYGRRGECIPLFRRLRQRSSVSIVGRRRIGKSWLLKYLGFIASSELGMGYQIACIDATLPSCNTLDHFTESMLKELDIPLPEQPSITENMASLEKTVKAFAAKNEVLVLCIDEFEGLCDKQGALLSLLEQLRAITNVGLCLVIASRDPLISIITRKLGPSGACSPFFNVFEQMTLKPFIRKEAEAFARAKSAQAGFSEEEYIYLMTLGQEKEGQEQWFPLRLQLVGKMIEEDKYFSQKDVLYPYIPEMQDYWQEFIIRLEEKYRGVVE
jgi:transcriptional regulator with XRE-family HTH domain